MAKKYEELTFHDDFLFCKILENRSDLCRKLLELTLGHRVGKIVTADSQKAVEILPDRKGVRFDVYAEGEDRKVYDVEMQNVNRDSLAKRTRYSQAMIDLHMLERGSHYRELKASYIIFICRFNPFEKAGRHKYSFLNICREECRLQLGDETEKIFLCTEGSADDISEDMKSFLRYIAEGIPSDSFTRELETAVQEAREDVRWRREYMTFQEQLELEREEGRKEERVNTEREKKRADAAEANTEKEKKRADAAEANTEKEKKRADAAEELVRRLKDELEALRREHT